MKRLSKILLSGLAAFLIAPPAWAQALDEPGEVTDQPVCFTVQNTAPYTVYGTFVTNFYKTPEGVDARHHLEFKLESKHFAQLCAQGPFFPGRKLDLQIRTLIPIFECRTGTNGTIMIHGDSQPDGSNKTYADCL